MTMLLPYSSCWWFVYKQALTKVTCFYIYFSSFFYFKTIKKMPKKRTKHCVKASKIALTHTPAQKKKQNDKKNKEQKLKRNT